MGERWPSLKANRLLAVLLRKGWRVERTVGSHKHLVQGDKRMTFSFHESVEVGGRMVARVAKEAGLTKEDL